MEANSKLQRKKRIAHSHLSKSNLDGSKLPLDDFVYKIMNDMDSNNIMSSYELSQDSKSKRRQETSTSNCQYSKNTNPDSHCTKLGKKFLPKKSHPLMVKCQTSLKYLNKNRCFPKPRAHVGSIPKPPKQPAAFPGPSISNSMTENVTNSVRRTEVQSKAYRQLIESNLIRDNNKKIQDKTTEKEDIITQDNDRITQDNDSSNSDDDAAYEHFLKRTKEENKISSDSDSDSRLTIIRKKGKSAQRRKQFKRQSTKCIPKVTSIPLSDSSDSQSEDASEDHERLTHRKLSTKNRPQVPAKTVEFPSNAFLDELPDINTNYSSSEEDSSVGSAAKENAETTVDFIDKIMPVIENSSDKVSTLESSLEATHQQGDQNLASIFDSISQFPCCVRLKRDPIIEQKAQAYISSLNYSTVDCINISDESDTESSTLPSNDSLSISSNSQHRSTSVQSFDSSDIQEIDDCIIMCELPKVGAGTSHEQPPASTDITQNSTDLNCEQSSNFDKLADVTPASGESTSRAIEEFKVQIVAVQSVIEKSENSTIAKAEEESGIEIIDLSDDEVISQQNDGASKNFEVVRQLDAEPNTTDSKHDINDNHFIPSDQNRGSQMLLSNPINQSHCQESPVQVQKISTSKILDVLNKIDFNSIKEILSKTNSDQSEALITGKTLLSNEEQHASNGRPLPDSTDKNFSKPNAAKQIVAVGDNFHYSNAQKQIMDPEMEDIGENKSHSCTINVKKRKDTAIYRPVIKKPKYEMFENSSDELDVIAASLTEDLGTPNNKVDTLLNLYKEELAIFMNIANTEANVTQGLRMLRDKQSEKLTHLLSSIKNVVKHDPCCLTAIHEKFQSKAQASIKSEEKLKPHSLIPPGSSVNNDIPVHAQTNIEVIDGKPSGSGIPVHHPKLEGKLTSSEHHQEAGTLAQSEVKVKHSAMTTDRERLLEYLRSLKCDECGKPAAVSCQGCAQAFYCSPQCAAFSWKKRHKLVCRRRMQVGTAK